MQFWPREAGCCCDTTPPEPCTSLCVIVTDAETLGPIAGATLVLTGDGVELDTCTTDADGECCLDIPPAEGEVAYVLGAEATGYLGSSAGVTLTGGDAEGVCSESVPLTPETLHCLDITIFNCGCLAAGVTVAWDQAGYSTSAITGADGIATLCFTEEAWEAGIAATLTISGAGYVTLVEPLATGVADAAGSYAILLVDSGERFCEHELDGGSGECLEYYPATLTATLAETTPGSFGGGPPIGTSITLFQIGTDSSYNSGCLTGTGFAAKYRIAAELDGGTHPCGERHDVTAVFRGGTGVTSDCSNLVSVGTAYSGSVLGDDVGQSTSCPVSVVIDLGGGRTITITE